MSFPPPNQDMDGSVWSSKRHILQTHKPNKVEYLLNSDGLHLNMFSKFHFFGLVNTSPRNEIQVMLFPLMKVWVIPPDKTSDYD